MTWNPPVDLDGDTSRVEVSASDIESSAQCGRFLALKTHRGIRAVDGWQRLFPPRNAPRTFVLGTVREIVRSFPDASPPPPDQIDTWIVDQVTRRAVPRQLAGFVQNAVSNVLEALDSMEAEVGSLKLVDVDPAFGPRIRRLTAWADVYDSGLGVRQVHRLRLGSARPASTGAHDAWSATAARIATEMTGATPSRIRVVEIGCKDGSTTIKFDGDAGDARTAFDAVARARAAEICEADHVVQSWECGDCKAAGSCAALPAVDGFLGQDARGVASRSVSPADLERYATCPAQWLMVKENLPGDSEETPSSARGRIVHAWLATAHRRGTACTRADLPATDGAATIGDLSLTAEEYSTAKPFLLNHIDVCPLAGDDCRLVSVEEAVRGYDHDAEVVVAMTPDLVYQRGESLVFHEVKTTQNPPGSRDEALDAFLQVPFALRMLDSGVVASWHAGRGTAELEVVSAEGASVWTWQTTDAMDMLVAASRLELIANEWHTDITWQTRPSPACSWCAVRRWCPDREVWEATRPATKPPF